MKCFYHSVDFDGKCSAAIVKLANPNCELIGIDYGDTFPWDLVVAGEITYMVDFAIQPNEDMLRLDDSCALIWIDHHKTALEWASEAAFNPPGLREVGLAGCELTWRHLHGGDEFPRAVALLGRYDVWDHFHPQTLPFQYGMRLAAKPPEDTAWWHDLFSREQAVLDIVDTGHILMAYAEQSHEGVCKMCGFDLEWEGLRWTVVNGPYRGSAVHKSRFDHDQHDAMLGFYWTGKQWMFSMTTDKPDIDVSVIAKRNGGGGHRCAAGFQSQSLPFTLGTCQGRLEEPDDRQ